MDSATILVLFLCAGVVALLVWFELNSLRNDAGKKATSAETGSLPKENQIAVEPKRYKKKAA